MSKEIRVLKERMAKSLSKKAWKDALGSCLKLRELLPQDERINLRLGEVYERLGRTADAVEVFKDLVEIYANNGRLARAISVAKRITAIDPTDESAHKKLALLYSARGLPVSPRILSESTGADHVLAQQAPKEGLSDASGQGMGAEAQGDLDFHISGLDGRGADCSGKNEAASRQKLKFEEFSRLNLVELDLERVELDNQADIKVSDTPLFSDLAPEELHEVMHRLTPKTYMNGESVVRQGDAGDSVFIVCDGRVKVKVKRLDRTEVEIAVLEEGAFFGEFGIFTNGLRHASVIAEGNAELLEMREDDLFDVCRKHPRVRNVLARFYRERAVETSLAVSGVFGNLGPDERRTIAKMASEEKFEKGANVIQEGDEASGLYLVRKGRLLVRTEMLSGEPVLLAELGPGDFFGEVSTLSGSPTTADVIASETCELLKLSRLNILRLCDDWPDFKQALEGSRSRRLHETIERLGERGVV